jgi:pimeloyl-ACP methyl ester carboxylesterase
MRNLLSDAVQAVLLFSFAVLISTPPAKAADPATSSTAAAASPVGIKLEGYDYPYPLSYFELNVAGQTAQMAYMDVAPAGDGNGSTVLLLHGKNFPAAYWAGTIEFLSSRGYRVIAPDQLGFGKSDKPELDYSFELLADNTRQLLDSLCIESVTVIAHSMGGMLAGRFALLYPGYVERLVLTNPIGLEDYSKLAPQPSLADLEKKELATTLQGLRDYHRKYYAKWQPQYDEWPLLAYRMTLGPDWPRLARVNALTAQMIWQQPVVQDFPLLTVPVTLIIGQEDRTALGKDLVSAEQAAKMGNYPQLGRAAAAAIPGAELIELPGVGHLPHLESPEKFRAALLDLLP